MKMLDAPGQHRAALARWIAGKEGRWELYNQLLNDVCAAGDAAAAARMRVAKPERPTFTRRPAVLAIATVVILAVSVTLALRLFGNPGRRHIQSHENALLSSRVGEVREIRLDDGSRITLDTGTVLHVRFSPEERLIDLERGRARFMVAHDAGRPFVVQAAGNEVVATGTAFDVSYRGRIVVHLLQGSVEVRLAGWQDRRDPKFRLRLMPGEQLSFSRGQTIAPSVMTARPSDEQWISGVKSLDDVPISELISEANSYSETQIVLADPSLGSREIVAEIHIRDIDAVAEAIATYLEAKIDRSQQGKLIIRK
jgi:transmembrane sensor